MFGWFKKEGKKFEELESSIKNSFQNMKTDMSQVSQWITHFKTKHDEHTKNFESLHTRLAILEDLLEAKHAVGTPESQKVRLLEESEESEENSLEVSSSISSPTQNQWDELTPTLKQVCDKLRGLKKESPRGWVSMKAITREMYPSKEYSAMRSTMSQFMSTLEVHGFVERKRVGKQAFVHLLDIKKEKKVLKENHKRTKL